MKEKTKKNLKEVINEIYKYTNKIASYYNNPKQISDIREILMKKIRLLMLIVNSN